MTITIKPASTVQGHFFCPNCLCPILPKTDDVAFTLVQCGGPKGEHVLQLEQLTAQYA